MMDRRAFVRTAAAASIAPMMGCDRPTELPPQPWSDAAVRKPDHSAVAVLAADAYDERLVDIVRRGVQLAGLDVRGRRVVLKPNFVEFDPDAVINTNPALIAATLEAFRSMGAADVVVGEGPGHRRDTEYIVTASGLHDALHETGTRYVDLNGDAVRSFASLGQYTGLERLWLPETIVSADLLVSMPKMKMHHWAGVTLSMKNLFGIMPGAVYGWPKNLLHVKGIHQSIMDINATLPVPRFNIVDGIIGMEGNGPIQGTARHSGVLVFGEDPVAVDATAARLMGVEPARVWYILQANRFLGNMDDARIEQRGEPITRFAQDYEVIDSMQDLRQPIATAG
jgi:uncharacterized protein (DUF362 family)